MARKSIPAASVRDRSRDDESLLLRSAESLGRMIGSLQRQLEIATGRLSKAKSNGTAKSNGGAPRKTAAAGRRATAKNGTITRGNTRKKSVSAKRTKKR